MYSADFLSMTIYFMAVVFLIFCGFNKTFRELKAIKEKLDAQ